MHALEKPSQRAPCALLGGSGLRSEQRPLHRRAPALCLPWRSASSEGGLYRAALDKTARLPR